MNKPRLAFSTLLKLLLLPLHALAQDWRPVSISDMFHYRHVDSSHITHTIRIDSARLVGADSVFYLNRVLARYVFNSNYTLLRYQGQFLGQQMTVSPDGTITLYAANLFGDTSIVLKPEAGLGESWIAGGNLSASVTEVSEGVVLGVEDSLKTIAFSNGAEWVLSKNHGLVRIPDPASGDTLVLAGLELAEQGLQLFDFLDIFTFHPGDVFEYQTNFSTIGSATETRTKRYILEANISADTAHYVVRELKRTTVLDPAPQTTEQEQITDWIFLRADWERVTSYNNQLVQIAPLTDIYLLAQLHADGITLGNDTFNISAANCGVLRSAADTALAALDVVECVTVLHYFEDLREGLGRVNFFSIGQDQNIREWLVGAVVQGDTVFGALTPDNELVNAGAPAFTEAVSVFPNPTNGPLTVTPASSTTSWRIEVFSASGQSVEFTRNTSTLDLSAVPSGLYFIKITGNEGAVAWQKVLKN